MAQSLPAAVRIGNGFSVVVRAAVWALTAVAGAGVLLMMTVTCVDVVMRLFGAPLRGSYDIVKIAGAVTIAAALPYTTAVKGHVAIEYFFLKLRRPGRIIVDTVTRLLGMTLFTLLGYRLARYGGELRAAGEVTATLQVPVFWIPYVLSASCLVVALVILNNLLHPGRETIRP